MVYFSAGIAVRDPVVGWIPKDEVGTACLGPTEGKWQAVEGAEIGDFCFGWSKDGVSASRVVRSKRWMRSVVWESLGRDIGRFWKATARAAFYCE